MQLTLALLKPSPPARPPPRQALDTETRTEANNTPEAMDKLCAEGVVCVGDPEACIRTIKRWEELGIDQIMCLIQAGRIQHETAMESIRNFGKYVIPYFKQRENRR